jgi:hypothetical protein
VYLRNRAIIAATSTQGAFTDDKDYRYTFFNLQAGAGATYHYNKGSFNVNYHFNKVNRHFIDDSTDVGGFSTYQDGLYEGRNTMPNFTTTSI